jgi:translation initiation factor IF-1
MDLYSFSLALGAAGLGVMALSGLGSRHHGDSHAGAGHGHAGHGHAGHSAHGHGGHAHAGHTHAAPGHAGHSHASHHDVTHVKGGGDSRWSLGALLSPRLIFGLLLGFGATGFLGRHLLSGPLLFAVALIGGAAFELLAAGPVSNFFFRFASRPALTLESAIEDEVHALSGFDANGQGMVALELDGQRVQLLATLSAEDRAAGVRVRTGDRLIVQEVDAARNRCTVSVLGS